MCCLFGLMDYGRRMSGRHKSLALYNLASACEVRGTDATGVAYNSGGRLRIYKRPVVAHRMRFHIPGDAAVIMGHTRMTTQGSARRNYNNHPFPGRTGAVDFALAHNGVLYNDVALRDSLHLPKTKIQTDSYIAVQLLQRQNRLDFSSLCNMAEQVSGSFTFTVLDGADNLYFVKGDNPLCIYHYADAKLLVYASTEAILRGSVRMLNLPANLRPEKVMLRAGDILKVSSDGCFSQAAFDASRLFPQWRVPYGVSWSPSSRYATPALDPAESEYIQELKSVAGAFGCSPDEIDFLLSEGFSPEELEEYLYCGEL